MCDEIIRDVVAEAMERDSRTVPSVTDVAESVGKIAESFSTKAECYKTFYGRNFANVRNKLECLSMASLYSLVYCRFVKQEPILLKNLSGALQ
jgi:hypothetical protein